MNKQAVIESGRAEFALHAVQNVVNSANERTKDDYKSYAKKFPSLVLANGLAAAIAFVCEKKTGNEAWGSIYTNISEWLIEKKYFTSTVDKSVTLEKYVCSLTSDEYRIVTNEVLLLFEWLRRFAAGMIEGEATNAS